MVAKVVSFCGMSAQIARVNKSSTSSVSVYSMPRLRISSSHHRLCMRVANRASLRASRISPIFSRLIDRNWFRARTCVKSASEWSVPLSSSWMNKHDLTQKSMLSWSWMTPWPIPLSLLARAARSSRYCSRRSLSSWSDAEVMCSGTWLGWLNIDGVICV
ncbi:uncharacterized protein YALI1_A06402g [Yarrowia lipolytica]|uniref:Uncharacterized protein n=1 Tax=Yarrowia lipolytica TaxID=4952 RepID=A0A1D8N3W6_YARLL|nr:hypothetical protein YALI1_A06402g [Yarrowia lipolytica]